MNALGYSFNTAAGLISFLIGFVIPLVTAFFAKQSYSRSTKGVITVVLAGITSFLAMWLQALNSHYVFDWKPAVLTTIVTTFIAVGSYFGWWKGSDLQVGLHNAGNKD